MQGEFYKRETVIDVMTALGSARRTVAQKRTRKTWAKMSCR